MRRVPGLFDVTSSAALQRPEILVRPDLALAAEQADLSFQLFMQARNKIVSAYQEVMRMQI